MSASAPLPVPQTDPRSSYLAHKAEIDAAIDRTLQSGRYILGEEVAAFEAEFAAYVGVDHAVGVGSGTDAITLALWACGIEAGSRVLTVSHTAVATVAAIERANCIPVLVDIDPITYTMDPNCLEDILRRDQKAADGRFKAVIPVHLYGHPADMPAILSLAERYGLWVIEDCAQAHGSSLSRRKAGAWGDAAAFSFYPTKNLGALGDGGAVLTSDPQVAEQARSSRQYGWKERFVSETAGMNSRLDEVQAAILRVKLRYLDEENDRRRALAHFYQQNLPTEHLRLPVCSPQALHSYHQYVIRTRWRDSLHQLLSRNSIGTAVHYPVPVHLQPAYRGRLAEKGSLPSTEQAAEEVLSLPMHQYLAESQARLVAERISSFDPESGK